MQTTTSPLPSMAEIDPDSFYPCSDGRPLGETPAHFRNSLLLYDALEARFAGEPQVYVAGNMFVYYVPGDRLKHVSPDIFIVYRLRRTQRQTSQKLPGLGRGQSPRPGR